MEGIIEETVALLSKEFLSGIALTLEMDRSLPRARVPAGKVEQVLLNLIVNASEAMKGRGKLKISAHQRTAMIGTGAVLQPWKWIGNRDRRGRFRTGHRAGTSRADI